MEERDRHLFMLCAAPRHATLRELPRGFRFRACRRDELDLWMAMPFDSAEEARTHRGFMQSFFDRVYAPREDLFFERCTFAVDADDRPIATAFVWRIMQGITTFHWLKVAREHEGKGIGRAIVSHVMRSLDASDYPVLLHTHPTSARAVALYADVGFQMLTDPVIGSRPNDLEASLPTLRAELSSDAFDRLAYTEAPSDVLERLRGELEAEF